MRTGARVTVGRILLLTAAVSVTLAGVFWFWMMTLDDQVRSTVTAILLVVAAMDLFLGLRFLAEPGP